MCFRMYIENGTSNERNKQTHKTSTEETIQNQPTEISRLNAITYIVKYICMATSFASSYLLMYLIILIEIRYNIRSEETNRKPPIH